MRRILPLLLILSFILTSCGPAPTPPPDPVTIKFGQFEASSEPYDAWAEAFHEQNPHITVEMVPVGGDLESADVVVGSAMMLPYLQQEVGVMDITSFIEADETVDLADYADSTIELLSQGGEMLGLPASVDLYVTYYNRDMFDAAGVAYPQPGWTWDDFVMAGAAVRNRGAGEYGFVWGEPVIDVVMLAYSNGGWLADDLRNPTRPTLNDPAVIEALDWYGNLIYVHDIAPTQEQLRNEPFKGVEEIGVIQGKVGMWMGWISERGGAKGSGATWSVTWKNFNWGMAPPPQQVRAGTVTNVSGYFIPADAQHPEAAWRWIAYLSQQTPASAIPANETILASEAYERMVGEEVVRLAQTVLAESEALPPNLFEFQSALNAFGQSVNMVLRGMRTAEEALQAAQRQVE